MIEVQMDGNVDRIFIGVEDDLPRGRFEAALAILAHGLWPSIVAAGLSGESYARCVLASCASAQFFRNRGLDAVAVGCILDVSLRYGSRLMHPVTLNIGRSVPERGVVDAYHVVCRVKHKGRTFIIDPSIRQAYKRDRWVMPAEIVIAEEPQAASLHLPPEIDYGTSGYAFAARADIPQPEGTSMRLVWLLDELARDGWRSAPDARLNRTKAVCERLDWMWDVRRSPSRARKTMPERYDVSPVFFEADAA